VFELSLVHAVMTSLMVGPLNKRRIAAYMSEANFGSSIERLELDSANRRFRT
jgi:hypothetical protein